MIMFCAIRLIQFIILSHKLILFPNVVEWVVQIVIGHVMYSISNPPMNSGEKSHENCDVIKC